MNPNSDYGSFMRRTSSVKDPPGVFHTAEAGGMNSRIDGASWRRFRHGGTDLRAPDPLNYGPRAKTSVMYYGDHVTLVTHPGDRQVKMPEGFYDNAEKE